MAGAGRLGGRVLFVAGGRLMLDSARRGEAIRKRIWVAIKNALGLNQ